MKRNIQLLSVLLSLFPLWVNGQVILNEQFGKTTNAWFVGEQDEFRFSIRGGKYIIENIPQADLFSHPSIPLDMDYNRNWTIEARFNPSKKNINYGIAWGGTETSFHFFNIKGALSCGCGSHKGKVFPGGRWSGCKGCKGGYSKHIKKGSNVIKVEKKKNTLNFFINRKKVASTLYEDTFGNRVGFFIRGGDKLFIDYIKASYIK